MTTSQTLNKIRNEIILSGRETRYKLGAYSFVLQGLNFFHTKTGEKRHFSGNQLVFGLMEFAQRQFGPLAQAVLNDWGIHTTNDLGYIVYNLIDVNLIRKQESDSLEDFFDVVDFKKYFNKYEKYSINKSFIKSIKGA